VVHTPEGIASAVRHALRTNLPTSTFMQAGYRFDANTVHAELKQQEEDANV
jgi:DNA-binding winged helix-turn-helix (wHTH) protein